MSEIVDETFADASNQIPANVPEHEHALFNEQGMLTEEGITDMVQEVDQMADFRSYLEGIYSQDQANGQVTMFKDQGKSSQSSKDYGGSGNSAVLDRPPPTEGGGGGGDAGDGGGLGGGGGGAGDGGDGSSKKRDGDNRRVLEEDKFALKGMFAKDVVSRVLPPAPDAGFLAEISNINLIRDILKRPMPFRAAYDLETKRMHFFVTKATFGADIAEKFKDLTNDDKGLF